VQVVPGSTRRQDRSHPWPLWHHPRHAHDRRPPLARDGRRL